MKSLDDLSIDKGFVLPALDRAVLCLVFPAKAVKGITEEHRAGYIEDTVVLSSRFPPVKLHPVSLIKKIFGKVLNW